MAPLASTKEAGALVTISRLDRSASKRAVYASRRRLACEDKKLILSRPLAGALACHRRWAER